jgi:HD-GYP domain-containing protein (c-di-GMP phosphodiesterase class II)
MDLSFHIVDFLLQVFSSAFNLLNMFFFLVLFIIGRREKGRTVFEEKEILFYLIFSAGSFLFTACQLVMFFHPPFPAALFCHRLQHVGLFIGLLSYLNFPRIIFKSPGENRYVIRFFAVLIAAAIPLAFTPLFIAPVPNNLGGTIQGTETPFYYVVMTISLFILFMNCFKFIWYTARKRTKKEKLATNETNILAGGIVLAVTSMINMLVVAGVLPGEFAEMFGLTFGLIVNALLLTYLLMREVGNSFRSLYKYKDGLSNLRGIVEEEYENILTTIADIIEKSDEYTAGHSRRVMTLSVEIGNSIGLPQQKIRLIRQSGILHDIGKIGISTLLINKPGKLTPEEFEVVKSHSELGFQIVSHYKPFFEVATYLRRHHEKLNGSGYPDGLMSQEIPLISKILAVADIYDALNSKRPYRDPLTREKSLAIMEDMIQKHEIDLAIYKKLVDISSNLVLE